ncbi:TolC family protein [Mucilaginibacter sp. BT774]|uniref:TolC family protein n=1 Tax=Mucilaginibacter sp. BT774 TaxID=3062276 RepID=UPI002674C047|nr:TolC family protein [Mucilaginibacter sp. BT774]MDO3625118.1 TolC family protein [Mucilaginibacter sp. BT774]
MRFSKYILTFLFIGGSILANAQGTDTLFTLQKCLDIAIKNNLQVKQSNMTAESAKIDLRQSKENLLPSINANAQRTFYNGRGISPVTNAYVNQSQTNDSYNLNGNMTIFNGFALQNAIKSASLAYQAGRMNFQAAKDVVTVNVITGYLAILDNQEILNASKNALAVQQETVNRMEILEKQGANKAASDLTDQKGALATNEVSVVNAQNNLNTSRLNLFQLMNMPYQSEATFQGLNAEDLRGDYGADPNQVYESALQSFAAVKAAALTRQSAEKSVKAARGALYPALTIGGNLQTAYSNTATQQDSIGGSRSIAYRDQLKNNYNSSIGLGLSIPIFNNGYKRNTLDKAKLNALYQKDVEENTKIQLKQNIEQTYYNMMAAYKRYQSLNDQVKAYTESYRIYKLRFDAGVLTTVDFIIAKNNLESATVNLISAKYDYFIESKILDYYQGKLSLQ